MSLVTRMLAPIDGRSAITVLGRTYDPATAAVQDIPYPDADRLSANGWVALMPVGPTASRPPSGSPASGTPLVRTRGLQYLDTTLNAVVVFDGSAWRDAITGLAA